MAMKKRHFCIETLDDGSFLLSIAGDDLGEREQMSYDSLDDLIEDVKTDLAEGTVKKKKESEDDEGQKRGKGAIAMITKNKEDEDEE